MTDEQIVQRCEKDIEQSEDGYYYWWPTESKGMYSSHILRLVANRLDQLNTKWNKILDQELMK